MNRRGYLAALAACAITGTAGCSETLAEVSEGIDDLLEDDAVAQEDVYRQRVGLTFDASAGDVIRVSVTIRDEGSGRGRMTLYGPDGEEIDDARFDMSGETQRPWETFDAERDGEHRVVVDPRGDRDARLRVSVSVNDS